MLILDPSLPMLIQKLILTLLFTSSTHLPLQMNAIDCQTLHNANTRFITQTHILFN